MSAKLEGLVASMADLGVAAEEAAASVRTFSEAFPLGEDEPTAAVCECQGCEGIDEPAEFVTRCEHLLCSRCAAGSYPVCHGCGSSKVRPDHIRPLVTTASDPPAR